MKKYNKLIITNIISFYKVNLYNKLNEKERIKVIFISSGSRIREGDFSGDLMTFDHVVLNESYFESRNKISTFFKLVKEIFRFDYEFILFSGWEIVEAIPFLLNRRSRNGIVIESSIKETNLTGYKGILKRLIVSRVKYAFPSGILQSEILSALGFKGTIKHTHGVGITSLMQVSTIRKERKTYRYLYVGRISQEKNIDYLVQTFNNNGRELTIVGNGPDLHFLKEKANENIKFTGYINNSELDEIYLNHDVFILPSISEPWGLVIDEAIMYGLPVIVSENVGCASDMVIKPKTGLVFKLGSNLEKELREIEYNYLYYSNNSLKFDFDIRDRNQVESYIINKNE
ncbi:glycosyltransferase family 4 protein [Vibrio vulnificus]|uniref:glycosyltransferase family 4 protein n=1 Tax=Vibrio vulnificus TaxID=672 RepID=UPI001CDCECF2|nr:glycosyltransferase family 4 protein [Vibrio vulnificus]